MSIHQRNTNGRSDVFASTENKTNGRIYSCEDQSTKRIVGSVRTKRSINKETI